MLVIAREDPGAGDVVALLNEHLEEMRSISPPESKHALDLESLRAPGVVFITARSGGQLAGCGALVALTPTHAEIKSMRTAGTFRRRGVGAAVLTRLIDLAHEHGCEQVSIETGAQAHFEPARSLYRRFGFAECGPFGTYLPDANSVFMTMVIEPSAREPDAS